MPKVTDIKRIIYRTLKPYPFIQAVYVYGSYLYSSSPGDLDMYIILAETKNTLEVCDTICRALRSRLMGVKLDINICIDPTNEIKRPELLPYHMYIAQTGVLAYGSDILNPLRTSKLPMEVVYVRVAGMANRIRHTYFNSLDDRHNKWHKWLIYAMADAELAHSGTVDINLHATAKRFYDRYSDQLTFLVPLFTERILSLDWYMSAYYILCDHLKMLDEQDDRVILSEHEST